MTPEPVQHVAFAIFQAWARERDPARARQRFNRLPPAIRDQFDTEAKAALRVAEAYLLGAQAA